MTSSDTTTHREIYSRCLMGGVLIVLVSGQFSSQTVYASEGQCVAASEIVANNGLVSGSWSDTGVARNGVFDCIADVCRYTGEDATWTCSDPSFTCAGPDTGYEYTYSFTSPGNGTCTFIEYEEGLLNQSILLPVVDWYLVALMKVRFVDQVIALPTFGNM